MSGEEPPFDPSAFTRTPDVNYPLPEIADSVAFMNSCAIERHPFFERLAKDEAAARTWVGQEYIISTRFAQDLARWLSVLDNCHVRAIALPVFAGEHGRVNDGRASAAHASLAADVLARLGIDPRRITLESPTVTFLAAMREASLRPMFGAGFLGVGNERLLIPEYTAVRDSLALAGRQDDFLPFLMANVLEDSWHSDLIECAARGLASLGHDPRDFYAGAVVGVRSRLSYYDELESVCGGGHDHSS